MTGLPTFGENLILFFSIVLYLLPGYLVTFLFFPKLNSFAERITVGFSIVITSHILIGFTLSGYKLLNSSISTLIFISIYVFCIFAYVFKRPVLTRRSSNRPRNLIGPVCLTLIFLLAMQIFYAWEGLAPGIGSWDRGEHHIRLLYAQYHNELPTTEIGTIVDPFYPQGFNLASFFFSEIPMLTPFFNITNLDRIIAFFMATIVGLIAVAIHSLSVLYLKDKTAAVFASLSYLMVAFHFIFHSMPSSLALILIGTLLVLFRKYANNDLSLSYLIPAPFLLSAVLMIHPIMFFYASAVIIPLLILWVMSKEISGTKFYTMFAVWAGSLVFYTIFMFVFKPEMLFATLNYIGVRDKNSLATSGVTSTFSILHKIFQFRYDELIYYFSNALVLLPFSAIGLLHVRTSRRDILVILTLSVFLSISSIVWYDARTWFYLLYPFTLLSGLGINQVIINFRVNRLRLVSSIVLILVLVLGIVSIGVTNAYRGKGAKDPYYWGKQWRIRSYITEEEFELAEWINNNVRNRNIIGTPDDSPGYQVIEALTRHKILMGSGFGAPQSFQDIKKVFSDGVSKEEMTQIISAYNISILITNQANSVRILRDKLSVHDTYHPTPSYWVLILGDKNEK